MFHALYATVETELRVIMLCVNFELCTQNVMYRYCKTPGKDVSDHAVRLRFQNFKLKLTT